MTMTMEEILAGFQEKPLFQAAEKFFSFLGVKFSKQTELPMDFAALYEKAVVGQGLKLSDNLRSELNKIDVTHFIGTVNDETLNGNRDEVSFDSIVQNARYKGMLLFAVRIRSGVRVTRTMASVVVRAFNRVARQYPVIVLLLCDGKLSVATCERSDYKQKWRPGERLGRVSILQEIDCGKPHHGHLQILDLMSVRACRSFDALYASWQKVFSTSLLTEKFYQELFDWYTWATDDNSTIHFPVVLNQDRKPIETLQTKVIRLLTRTMFVWFVKQKGLIPASLFDIRELKKVLVDFDPLSKDCGCYYNAILQNLFFGTLNRAIVDEDGKRRFASAQNQVDSKNLYRYEELFSISQNEVVDMFAKMIIQKYVLIVKIINHVELNVKINHLQAIAQINITQMKTR